MKLNMKKVARRILPVVTAVMIVASMTISVSAIDATYSVNDFITDTYVDGANDIMSVVVPYKYNAWSRIYKNVSSGQIYGAAIYDVMLQDDPNVETTDPAVFDLVVSYNPLGVNGAESYFDIASMPSSTVFTLQNVVIIAMAQSTEFRTNMVQEFSVQYYDVNGEYLGTQKMDFTRVWTPEKVGIVTYDMGDITFKLDKPAGAKYGKFRMLLKFESLYFARQYSALTIDIDNFMFQMSITDAERELLYKNQEMLDEVNQQLAEQGKTLDELKNGTPEQNEQISGAVGEMGAAGDKLGDLSDQMEVERPDSSDMNVSINSFIPETSLLAYTGPILAFWENDSLQAMLIIVLTLVLVSWVMFGKKG